MCVTRRLIALLGLAGLIATPAAAVDNTYLTCTFTEGVTHTYEKGKFIPEKAAPLTFGITDIDAEAQKATLKTERGSGTLRVAHAVNATHFLEIVTEGFMNITTVYDKDDAKGVHPAVHSRHIGLFGQPLVTQYQGFCTPKK